jgi:hypothetical protein
MEETLRQELLAQTRQALDADDWSAVERLWQPWIEQGHPEAEYQLAYHYLWCTSCDDDAMCERAEQLVASAAAKNHPDAIWFNAARLSDQETNPEFERLLRRAGELGSVGAQRALGVKHATGRWTGPKDLAEAARWYRLAAENGDAESQCDLGFMLLDGDGIPKNFEEGVMWVERAGESGEYRALPFLTECYENGYSGFPMDAAKAALWRGRLEEYKRLNPEKPNRTYTADDPVEESDLDCLWEIEGVTGFGGATDSAEFVVFYEPEVIGEADLDEKVRLAFPTAVPNTPPETVT